MHVRKNRAQLLSAALTILVAHNRALKAQRPPHGAVVTAQDVASGTAAALRPWVNSYGNWSDRVRSAVVWATGRAELDPWSSNADVKEEATPERKEALIFFAAWHEHFGEKEVQVLQIAAACTPVNNGKVGDYSAALKEALDDLNLARPRQDEREALAELQKLARADVDPARGRAPRRRGGRPGIQGYHARLRG